MQGVFNADDLYSGFLSGQIHTDSFSLTGSVVLPQEDADLNPPESHFTKFASEGFTVCRACRSLCSQSPDSDDGRLHKRRVLMGEK